VPPPQGFSWAIRPSACCGAPRYAVCPAATMRVSSVSAPGASGARAPLQPLNTTALRVTLLRLGGARGHSLVALAALTRDDQS
jgi:hypothetical protein